MYGVESHFSKRVDPGGECKQENGKKCGAELWSSPVFKGVDRGETISEDVKKLKKIKII